MCWRPPRPGRRCHRSRISAPARPEVPPGPYLVAGLARAGAAAAHLLAARHGPGAVSAWESAPRESLRPTLERLEAAGVRVATGPGAYRSLPEPRTVVKSPGIRPDAPFLRELTARGATVIDEAELAWRCDRRPWIGVTGTNGKGTVAGLLVDILRAAGASPLLAGNTYFGPPLSAAVGEQADMVVAELSSFQLAFCPSMLPEAAVLTNVGFEHWEHHGGRAAYEEAKRALFVRGERHVPVAAIGVDDPVGASLVAELRELGARVAGFGRAPGADVRLTGCEWDLSKTRLEFETPAGTQRLELRMPGEHNALNALAAFTLADLLAIPPAETRRAIEMAAAPPGRFERVIEGPPFDVIVDYAHNAAGAERALETARGAAGRGRGRVIVLGSIVPTYGAEEQHALGIALGAADELVLAATRWTPEQPLEVPTKLVEGARDAGADPRLVPDREDAVAAAIGMARPGDLVLLTGRGDRNLRLLGRGDRPLERRDAELASAVGPA